METKWTQEPPTEPGWYWVRQIDDHTNFIVFVDHIGEVWGYPGEQEDLEYWPEDIKEPPA